MGAQGRLFFKSDDSVVSYSKYTSWKDLLNLLNHICNLMFPFSYRMTNENCIYISLWTTLLHRQLNILKFWSGGCILAVGDNYKELWGYCPYACCREKCSSWDGENSQEKGENVCRAFFLSIYIVRMKLVHSIFYAQL